MNNRDMKKVTIASTIGILMASVLVCSIPTIVVASTPSAEAGPMGKILIDYSHGQYKASCAYLDQYLASNLTMMGFEVVFLWGGINSTILADADALILSKIWGTSNAFLPSEVSAVASWFNAGNKFLWVGGESDYVEPSGGQYINDNMTLILEAVGSHVYLEPTAVQDPVSNAGGTHRSIANVTTSNPNLAGIVEGVGTVLVHSPTLLYGSNSATPGENVSAVALETTSIEDVYVLLQHSKNGTIVDGDLQAPYAHTNSQRGEFASVAIETHAGTAGKGALVVSGGSPIGHYWPMTESNYSGYAGLDGMRFTKNLVMYGILHASTTPIGGKILVDYSHGQYKASCYSVDKRLYTSLFFMGYEVIQLWGGLNSTILSDAVGLILSKIWGTSNAFLPSEVSAVASWFNAGNKFLWVGGESDYVEPSGGQYINDNMTLILEAVGSHVYLEPTAVQDPVSNAGGTHRPIANVTGTDPYVASILNGVHNVLVHSPTLLYGSNSATPGENVSAVALETTSIEDVYVLLRHSKNGTIVDGDLQAPYAHTNSQRGEFVSVAMEVNAGSANTSVLVVSGGSPIGHYWPMIEDMYGGVIGLSGHYLLRQAIDFGVNLATPEPVTTTTITTTTTTTTGVTLPIDPMLLAAIGVGALVVIIIIIVVVRKR
ncbi:MAG: hypothetical protein C4K48_07750 [Candidatus Thorarchaeota archaeon]|nr:MAG: hypothetical protein C4K48_07750 [Candidatus Thorarchaeota archaeon]